MPALSVVKPACDLKSLYVAMYGLHVAANAAGNLPDGPSPCAVMACKFSHRVAVSTFQSSSTVTKPMNALSASSRKAAA